MAEPPAKRAAESPAAWYDTPVVALVLQCIPAFNDVASMLEALPPSTRTSSGAALLTLHRQHGIPGGHLWPVLELDKIPHALMDLAVSVLPMVPTLRVSRAQGNDIVGSVHVSVAASDLVRSLVLLRSDHICSLATFLERYGHAIVRITLHVRGDAATGAVASALEHCTRPHQMSLHVSVDAAASMTPLLAAVATHALSALSLCIERLRDDDDDDDDDDIPVVPCPPMLLAWLALPIASSLRLVNVAFTDPGPLRRALCGLRYLQLVRVPTLLGDASDDAPRLSALKSLVATDVRLPSVHGLLGQLRADTLTRLHLNGANDWSPLLAGLGGLVELDLQGGTMATLKQVEPLARVPHLRALKLSQVHVHDKDAPILVAWLATAEALRELHWTTSALAVHGPVALAHALPRWLRLGLHTLNLATNFIGDDAAQVLSMAIAKGGHTHNVALDLSANAFKLPGLRALLLALSASVNVSIRLNKLQLMRRHIDELDAFAAVHGVQWDSTTQVYSAPPADATPWRL